MSTSTQEESGTMKSHNGHAHKSVVSRARATWRWLAADPGMPYADIPFRKGG